MKYLTVVDLSEEIADWLFRPLQQTALLGGFLLAQGLAPSFAQAQSVIPSLDGTGTVVTVNGNQFEIGGGQQAGVNLFQSFQKFGLDQGQIATFLSNPAIQNIIGRVVGGDPSAIDGLIQVTGGNSNLYLMNPAGILFGPNASLNVPASFLATTANGIGVGPSWFNASGPNDYAALAGSPDKLAFTTNQPGSILNAGNLAVGSGQSLVLAGGVVINTGSLSAPGGEVILAAVPGQQFVTLSQPGSPLSLQVQAIAPTANQPSGTGPVAVSLPALLTAGGQAGNATNVSVNSQGEVILSGSGIAIPTTPGTTILAGTSTLPTGIIDVSSATGSGGNVALVGTRVGLINAQVNATGPGGGGTVLIGGNYQGLGTLPTASRTFVDQTSVIRADALTQGNGGTVIVWADQITAFLGSVSARGGSQSGNGGFVEISGKESLSFNGNVDLSAPAGTQGTVLFDPRDITIVAAGGADDAQLTVNFTAPNAGILASQGATPTTDFTINAATLTAITGGISLQATRDIIIASNIPNLFFNANPPSITFTAGRNFVSTNTSLSAFNSTVTVSAASIQSSSISAQNLFLLANTIQTGALFANNILSVGSASTNTINTGNISGGSTVTLTAAGDITTTGFSGGQTINVTSTAGNINLGNSRIFNAANLSLTAPSGLVTLTGAIGLGTLAEPASTINIQAARFRAINPLTSPADLNNNSIPVSLFVYPANASPASTGQISLQFGNQTPILAPANGSGPTLITLKLLQDTSFTVGRPLGPTGSGTAGFIGLAVTFIPPNVLVLLQDNQFNAIPAIAPDPVLTIQPVLPQVDASTVNTVQSLEQQRTRSTELPECDRTRGSILKVSGDQAPANAQPASNSASSTTRSGAACVSN